MFRPPSLLAPQVVPTAANTAAGQPGLLRPGTSCFVASARTGYANRPNTGNWRCRDSHPARLRPCRLLLSATAPVIPSAGRLPLEHNPGLDFGTLRIIGCGNNPQTPA